MDTNFDFDCSGFVLSISILPALFFLYCAYLIYGTDSSFMTMEGYMLLLNSLSIGHPESSYIETAHSWGPVYPYLTNYINFVTGLDHEVVALFLSVTFASLSLLMLPIFSRILFGTIFPGVVCQAGMILVHMFFDFVIRLEIHATGYFFLGLGILTAFSYLSEPSDLRAFLFGSLCGFGVMARVLSIAPAVGLLFVFLILYLKGDYLKEELKPGLHGILVGTGVLIFILPYCLFHFYQHGHLFPPGRWLHFAQNALHAEFFSRSVPYSYAEWFQFAHLNYSLLDFTLTYPFLVIFGFVRNVYLFFHQIINPADLAILFIFVGFASGVYLTFTVSWQLPNFGKNKVDHERIFLVGLFWVLWLLPLLGPIYREMHQFLPIAIFYPVFGIGYLFWGKGRSPTIIEKLIIILVLVGIPLSATVIQKNNAEGQVVPAFRVNAHTITWSRNRFEVSKADIPGQRENFRPLTARLRKKIIETIARDRGISVEKVTDQRGQEVETGRNIIIATHFYLSSVYEMGFSPILLRPPSYDRTLKENFCYEELPQEYDQYFRRFSFPPGKSMEDRIPADYVLVFRLIEKIFTKGVRKLKGSDKSSNPLSNERTYFEDKLKKLERIDFGTMGLYAGVRYYMMSTLYKVPENLRCSE